MILILDQVLTIDIKSYKVIEGHGRSWKVKEGHGWSFPITWLTFQGKKVMCGWVCYLQDYSFSPSPSPYLLDLSLTIFLHSEVGVKTSLCCTVRNMFYMCILSNFRLTGLIHNSNLCDTCVSVNELQLSATFKLIEIRERS